MMLGRLGPTPWTRIQCAFRKGGIGLGMIALGAWGDGIFNGTAKLPWLHQQAAVLHDVQTSEVPALKAEAGCERWRGDVNQDLALRPTMVQQSDLPAACKRATAKK